MCFWVVLPYLNVQSVESRALNLPTNPKRDLKKKNKKPELVSCPEQNNEYSACFGGSEGGSSSPDKMQRCVCVCLKPPAVYWGVVH